jgi:hypothetical protein
MRAGHGIGNRCVTGLLAAAVVIAAPARAVPRVPRARVPSKIVLPPGSAPAISTTSRVPEYAAAEGRLAQFITALHVGRRARAVSLLSSRVTAAERQALLEKRWLRQDPRSTRDFAQVLFAPDLQIRSRAKIKDDMLRLSVSPRLLRRKRFGQGYLEVPMRREHGEWFVELHPEKQTG